MRFSLPQSSADRTPPPPASPRLHLLAVLSVAVAVLLVYQPSLNNGYVGWDDTEYVRENRLVNNPTPASLWAIWSTFETPQYYPLVFTSFLLEYRIWGREARGYHATNLALHATNSVLVYIFLILLGCTLPTAWVAGLFFGLHPIHVESVAWIAERKDVLSGLFFFLSGIAYLRFLRKGGKTSYVLALFCFLCALFSKTMVVSLPVLLIVMARWKKGASWKTSVFWSLPFFALALVAGIVTVLKELSGPGEGTRGFVNVAGLVPALRAATFYLGKILWPVKLCAIYASFEPSVTSSVMSGAVVIALGVLAWKGRHRLPYVSFGIAFFGLVSLPILGVLRFQFLAQTPVADHFMYLPSLGILLVAAETLRLALASGLPRAWKWGVAGIAACLLLACGWCARDRASDWRDGETLWTDTVAKNPASPAAANNLAGALHQKGDDAAAEAVVREALERFPNSPVLVLNLASLLSARDEMVEAARVLEDAVDAHPDSASLVGTLAAVYLNQKRLQSAEQAARRALELAPRDPSAHLNLGLILKAQGRNEDALVEFREAFLLDPWNVETAMQLGLLLRDLEMWPEAEAHYRRATRTIRDNPALVAGLALSLQKQDKIDEAISAYRRALALDPAYEAARNNLAALLSLAGHYAEAEAEFQEILRRGGNPARAHYNLACVYSKWGKPLNSLEELEKAIDAGFDNLGALDHDPDLVRVRGHSGFNMLRSYLQSRISQDHGGHPDDAP